MFTITADAAAQLRVILQAKGQADYAVRLRITGRGVEAFEYDFRSVPRVMQEPHEDLLEIEGLAVLVGAQDRDDLAGAVIGLKEDGGLMIDNPNPVWRDEVGQLVARVIAEKINPALALHGGSITLVDVKEGTAYVRMGGGCQGCSLRNLTLKGGIDQMIRNVAPGITQVIDVTRHEMGANPYYAGPAPLGGASPVAETAAPEG